MEPERINRKKWSAPKTLRQIPIFISQRVEHFFYEVGFRIAQRPQKWLVGCSIVVLLCLGGLFRFRQEKNPLKLWVPPDSDFVRDTEWLMSHFSEGQRIQSIIMTGDNVLEPEALVQLNEITKRVIDAQTHATPKITWTDVCLKVPVISGYVERRRRDIGNLDDDFFEQEPEARLNSTKFEPVVYAPTELYCGVLNSLSKACLLFSILDIWDYNSTLIASQTKADIIAKFNSVKVSPTLGHPMNFSELLGGTQSDQNGRIISAKAVQTLWMVHVNFSRVDMDEIGNDAGTADWATPNVLVWESAFLDVLKRSTEELSNTNNSHKLTLYYEAGRSFGDISSSTMFQDIDKLIIGIILMSFYVQVILSKFNWVEWRFCLTSAGLLCVAGAFIIAVGVCSLFGVPYGPVHTSLPFMLMGLGVDDIFVMMASWEQILPSLHSFCVYAAVGVLVTFLLQVTFFVGFFTLDTRRIEAKRNGVLPCIIHENFEIKTVDSKNRVSWKLIDLLYSKIILTIPGKIIILLITISIASVGILGSNQLEQWFDSKWFLPKESYLSSYIQVHSEHYPQRGDEAAVYMGELDYHREFQKILSLTEKLMNDTNVQIIEPWPTDFAEFVTTYYGKDMKSTILDHEDFTQYLSKFLFSRSGGKYQRNFHFNSKLTCGIKVPRILVASIPFRFAIFSGPNEWIPAMDTVKEIAKESNIQGFVTVWSKMFGNWETDKVISQEVTRNLILALICVMGTTAVLIAEPQTCFWILLCVLLTLLDVCGFMFYWGLTVDIVSCIGLELAVGLSVDYAAHVAHAFLNTKSYNGKHDRTTRALTAVRHIGAAVMYGAGSTLLALSLLAGSQAYVFRAFFKIFLLVILFGLWHGLLMLPVVLSTVGPRALRDETTILAPPKRIPTISPLDEEKDIGAMAPLNNKDSDQ
ncbi:NPC1-like intracellular cholesterol transporter 1 isoform X2 [Cephus cinctus]|uniref:NPC1-like intracellular cholesterol transporter 1 isoform X2 n=1 Tax=Cephus cinctus TaxID=211228 RepID=A0AAJ7FMT3_CEPCN|nr:NPC1-like intracellular cholesterol transporter 1 isoform X2 [Cephus cinctus]